MPREDERCGAVEGLPRTARLVVAILLLATPACGRNPSYEEGFKAGQRLSTLGIGGPTSCKAAFVLSSATDRNSFLEGCSDGITS